MFSQDPKVMNFFNERVDAASCRHIKRTPHNFFSPPVAYKRYKHVEV